MINSNNFEIAFKMVTGLQLLTEASLLFLITAIMTAFFHAAGNVCVD
jgi:hypothetical protein